MKMKQKGICIERVQMEKVCSTYKIQGDEKKNPNKMNELPSVPLTEQGVNIQVLYRTRILFFREGGGLQNNERN